MKSVLHVEKFDPTVEVHGELARQAEEWYHSEKTEMLELTAEAMARHPLGIVAFTGIEGQPAFVGYNAVSREYEEDGTLEIGGLYIAPPFRKRAQNISLEDESDVKHHIKEKLFEEMRPLYPGRRIVIFANTNSYAFNIDLGFHDASLDEVPAESLAVCRTECGRYETCVEQLGQICCDQIIVSEVDSLPIIGVQSEVGVVINSTPRIP